MKSKRPPKAKQETQTSEFTAILRRIWEAVPSVLVAAFVDTEGECIDYVSSWEPFDAKVSAAEIYAVVGTLLASKHKRVMGEPHTLEMVADGREFLARRIDDSYTLIVGVTSEHDRSRLKKVLARAVREFRCEAGTVPPAWEPPADVIQVEIRSATGWKYAPVAFCEDGIWVSITDVLGRWIEPGRYKEKDKICFRIRTEQGVELTLVHDPESDQWISSL